MFDTAIESGNVKTLDTETLVSVGSWKQMREKFQALQDELSKWLTIRDHLGSLIDRLSRSIDCLYHKWFEDCQLDEQRVAYPDICRGLNLVKSQINLKSDAYHTSVGRPGGIVSSFQALALVMLDTMDENERHLVNNEDSNSDQSINSLERRLEIINELQHCHQNLGAMVRPPVPTHSSLDESNRPTMQLLNYEVRAGGLLPLKNKPSIDGPQSWTFLKDDVSNCGDSVFIEVTFIRSEELAFIAVQGGHTFPQSEKPIQDDIFSVLPCGLGIQDCDGTIEKTVTALSDVLSWKTITKSNSPETFLVRPPVRFLFDVIKAVDTITGTHLISGVDDEVDSREAACGDWSVVGVNKETKLAFMEKVLMGVSAKILLPPPTTANSIVTGSNANLTNIFLQHLSIVAFAGCKGLKIVKTSPMPSSIPEGGCESQHFNEGNVASWVDEFKLSWSYNGSSYSNLTEAISTNLKDAMSTKIISLHPLKIGGVIKSLRIYPCKWENVQSCLRFSLHSFVPKSSTVNEADFKVSENCIKGLKLLRDASDVLGVSSDYIVKIDELASTRRQEEAMKKMESIVGEKIAKEQALLDEKLALNTEKCSLEEKLKATLSQLHDMEKTVVKEKSHRLQLDELRNALEDDKKALQLSVHEHVEAMADLQTQLFKVQAISERDNRLLDTLRKRSESDQSLLLSLREELSKAKEENNTLSKDYDDLLNQVEVLTDERDDARRNEEELFVALGEVTHDSEILQESYVTMSDRCNGYMDEIFDLQANIASLKDIVNEGLVFKRNTEERRNGHVIVESQSTPKITVSTPNHIEEEDIADIDATEDVDDDNYDEEFEDEGE
mmetsp:Transcript_6634/g.10871  ORF Transcript_6634/g.10871 Transcript_6634/m.10871 type:complete len:839 (+) Transcript_6634:1849-4365(+)